MKNIKEFILNENNINEGYNISHSDIKSIVNLATHFGHIIKESTLNIDLKLLYSVASYAILNIKAGYIIAFCDDEKELENCFKEISKQISKKAVHEYIIFNVDEQKYMNPEEEGNIKYKFAL